MIEERYCIKDNPMPLELGPKAEEMQILWHHDQIVDLDPENECERFLPFMCISCGYKWVADLGN